MLENNVLYCEVLTVVTNPLSYL